MYENKCLAKASIGNADNGLDTRTLTNGGKEKERGFCQKGREGKPITKTQPILSKMLFLRASQH